MTVNIEEAKKSWEVAGLNEQGKSAVHAWIETLANNIISNPGRWGAYARSAYCQGSDFYGCLSLLQGAVEMTSKK